MAAGTISLCFRLEAGGWSVKLLNIKCKYQSGTFNKRRRPIFPSVGLTVAVRAVLTNSIQSHCLCKKDAKMSSSCLSLMSSECEQLLINFLNN